MSEIKRWTQYEVLWDASDEDDGTFIRSFDVDGEFARLRAEIEGLKATLKGDLQNIQTIASQAQEIAELKATWQRACRFVLPGTYDTPDSIAKHIKTLESELATARAQIAKLEAAITRVRNSIAIGTWNVNPEMVKFSLEVSQLFEFTLAEVATLEVKT